jgi:hypothetical protein
MLTPLAMYRFHPELRKLKAVVCRSRVVQRRVLLLGSFQFALARALPAVVVTLR